MVFLEEENAIAEWEMGSQRKENDRHVMKREQRETDGRQRKAPGSVGGQEQESRKHGTQLVEEMPGPSYALASQT